MDAVLSEDVDTLMFGSGLTIRNWSPETTGKTPTHVNVYDAVKTKNGPSGLDREGMILVAMMSGGDYVPEGIPSCGPKTACEAARAGFGRDLCSIAKNDSRAMREWRERLQHELKTNESKLFNRKRPSLKIPDDFPRLDILGYYTHPAISTQAGLDKLRRSINWDQNLDFPGLRDFTHDAFDWAKLEGAKHFVRSLAPSLLVRQLRMRGEQNGRFPTHNIQAIEEDEALLVKGIHGKRQHMITDNTTELRVSFTPIELVRIDLSKEEPDEVLEAQDAVPPSCQAGEADLDEDLPLEIEDDDAAPRKRGPTKFDPYKAARIWVFETYVKVGVPLKVQDWEAGRQKPLKAGATTQTAPKSKGARRTKTTGDAPQLSIERFAKVTKPGVKLSQALAKAQSDPTDPLAASRPVPQTRPTIVDLLSSSPTKPTKTVPSPRQTRDKPLPPVQEDPPSNVSKRRRAPMQRSHTLPSDPSAAGKRLDDSHLDAIETLDLVDLPALPSPSQSKKARVRATKNPPIGRAARGTSVADSPGKTRQTTLDAWRASPATTPTKPRRTTPPDCAVARPAPPQLQPPQDVVETLDLTLSSPLRPPPRRPTVPTNPRRTAAPASGTRPPLLSISSNASQRSTSSSLSTSFKPKAAATARQTRGASPRLRTTKSASPDIDTLDLTVLSPQPPSVRAPVPSKRAGILNSPPPTQPLAGTLRRSPRNHASTSLSPEPGLRKRSSPAAWKAQAKKKREIILRKSLAGAWDFVEADSPAKAVGAEGSGVVLKGKERRKWRESEIEVLDLS